jgi:trypsin
MGFVESLTMKLKRRIKNWLMRRPCDARFCKLILRNQFKKGASAPAQVFSRLHDRVKTFSVSHKSESKNSAEILEGIMNKFAIQSAIVALMAGSLMACGSAPATTVTLSGVLYDDLNLNSLHEANEPGLKDWTVYLDNNGNLTQDAGEASAITNSSGAYSFSNVTPGSIKIGVHMHLGFNAANVTPLSTDSVDTRIINGSVVPGKEKFPFQVALINKSDGSQFCGGSLIAPHWVLTAAHCFFDKSTQTTFAAAIRVRIGVTDLNTQEGETLDVSQLINHPDYLKPNGNFNNDIALLKLSGNATQGTVILPAEASETSLNAAGTAVRVTGWGRTEAGTPSLTLREVGQQLSQDALCQSTWNSTPQMLCAQTPAGDTTVRESCSGDSGGPLFTDTATPRQVGVVSFGTTDCTDISKPGVYARVTAFDAWMGTTTGRTATDIDVTTNVAAGNTPGVGIGVQESQ